MLIIDLEMTCCNDKSITEADREVIQIGAVKLRDGRIFESFMTYVKPSSGAKLTAFCTELTGIEQAHVDAADLFWPAFSRLNQWAAGEQSFASWGKDDARWLRMEFDRIGVRNGFTTHCDLFKVFGRSHGFLLRRHRLEWHGRRHDALNDAMTYARLVEVIQPQFKAEHWKPIG